VGASFFPLDEQLGLLPERWSPRLQQIVSLLGTVLPFGQVPALLKVLCGVTISRASVRRLTERAGAALVVIEQTDAEQIRTNLPPSPAGPARQQVSVDGAMVPIVGGEWREVKTLVIGALADGDRGHAGELSYLSRVLEADRFAELATTELHRRGTFAADTVVAVADGALWCQQFYAYHLPDAIRILDFPHALEHLSRAAQSCFGPGRDATDWLNSQRAQLLAGQADAVCQAVSDLPVTQASNPIEAAQVSRQVVGYLRERLPHLAYADFLAAGYPIGSGAVESANKRVVEARLKGAGMHWSVDNANALLALRGALCSQRWDRSWEPIVHHRRQQRRRPVSVAPQQPLAPTPPRKQPSLPRRIANAASPNPYFTDGKPNATHPYKRGYARRYGTTEREASAPITKI
jgi:hypothetical protein